MGFLRNPQGPPVRAGGFASGRAVDGKRGADDLVVGITNRNYQ